MKIIKNFKYDAMGCFKTPDLNFTVLGEYEENNKGYHRCDYDMNVMVGSEEKLSEIYDNLVKFLATVDDVLGDEPDVMLCGLFLNGNDSLLFASDGTYEFENLLLSEIGINPLDYIRETHCNKEDFKEEYPEVYKRIKQFII